MAASKIPQYIEQRLSGLKPKEAALAAGYSQTGIAVTASTLEARDDVRKAIKSGKAPAPKPVSKARARSVASTDVPADLKPWALQDSYNDPLSLMLDVMNNSKAPSGLRIECAKTALPYCHARKEGGVKENKERGAKAVAQGGGRMSSMPAPTGRATAGVVPIRKTA